MNNHLRQTDELNRRRHNQTKALPVWYIGSMVLHGVAFGLIVWFTPLREIVIPEKKAGTSSKSTMTPRQLQELANRMDDLKRNDLLDNVQDIAANLREFEEIRDQMAENYLEFTLHIAETAPDLLEQLLAELEAQQKAAFDAMEVVDLELAKADAINTAEQLQEFQETAESADILQQNVIKEQIAPLDTLDKALSFAQMAGMRQTTEALQELLNNQNLAHELQQSARQTNDLARAAQNSVPWHQQRLNEEQGALERAENRLAEQQRQNQHHAERRDNAAAEVEKATATLADAREQFQQARQNADELHGRLDGVANNEEATAEEKQQAENTLKQADHNLQNAEGAFQRAENQLATHQQNLENAQAAEQQTAENVANETAAVADARQTVDNRQTTIETARQNAESLRRDMTPAQQNAKEVQRAAAQLLQNARQIAQSEATNPELNAEQFAAAQLPDYHQLSRMDTVDLYDTAVQLEDRILEAYRDVRATERAILANMSIQNARRLTDVARTERPEINREVLRGDTRTDAALERHKEALAQAVRETAGIHQSVATLLDTVRQVAGNHEGFSVDFALEWGQQMDEHADAVTAEGEMDNWIDLADHMRELMGESMGGDYNHPHLGTHGANMSAMSGAHMPHTGRPGENYVQGNLQSRGNRGNLPQIARGNTPGRGFGSGQYLNTSDPRAAMPDQVWGGRTVGEGGIPASWLGLTTWYVIGPFPNPARANIDRKFPPETVVDLDATYEGKNGPISWGFYQAPFPSMVTPPNVEPYGIWYGYTEVRFDRAADLWVAIGSDDKSKIWINDYLIWESAAHHKPWRTNEGFVRVHFRKGVNRILFRCENGQHGMGWSFVINLDPTAGR